MTPEGKQKLKVLLTHHESYKQFPYVDSTHHLTVGIGRNLTDRGISTTEALYLLDDDINYFINKLSHFVPCFAALNEARQIVLCDMCFNLGVQGLLNFTQMMLALEAQNYTLAAQEMLNSKWSHLADIMRTGEV